MNKNIVLKSIKYGFIGLFIFQVLAIVYVNMFQNDLHLGQDAAPNYINAIEIWRQGTLTPDIRHFMTNMQLDTAIPFAALLYGLTGNIFISFGIVNIIISLLIAIIFASIVKNMTSSKEIFVILIPLCFFFSPYTHPGYDISSALDDFYSLLYTSAAFWGFRMLVGFLIIKTTYLLCDAKSLTKTKIALFILSVTMAFICALSSGLYFFITFILPCLLFLVYKYLVGDLFLRNIHKNASSYFFILLIILTFAGRYACRYFFDFTPTDSPVLVGAEIFFSNFFSIFTGYLFLLSAIAKTTHIRVISPAGIANLVNMFIALTVLIAAITAVRHIIKKKIRLQESTLLMIFVIVSNFLMLILTNTRYGHPVFEVRYLLPIVAGLFALFGVFLSSYKNMKFAHKNVVYNILLSGLLVALIISNLYSFFLYKNDTIDDQKALAQEMSDVYNAELVYVGEQIIFANMRVLNTDVIFHYVPFPGTFSGVSKGTVGGYNHYLTAGEFTGETFLLATESQFEQIPDNISRMYIDIGNSGFRNWNIYKASGNYLNPSIATYISISMDEEHVIILSVKNCGSLFMDEKTQDGLFALGLKESLINAEQKSYIAVFDGFDVVYEEISNEEIFYKTDISYFPVEVSSAGADTGNISSICFDFSEFSLNRDGINVVVFNKVTGEPVDSVVFDLLSPYRMMLR